MVRWRVLGPLEVLAASGWAVVPAPKWRSLLAVLLAAPGDVVSIERLIDELWRENPPAAARKLVNGYVLRVRRLIGDRGGQILVTQVPGYRLAIAPVDVDTGRFEELLAAGRRALTCADAGQAAKLLADGLALWRGAALADVPPGPVATAEAARLEELRLAAVELRIEADLSCGLAAGLVAELHGLTAAHPLRERLWYLLMRVLAESGRPAEALAAYARAREVMAGELGAGPGPDLRRLHLRLLAVLTAPAAGPSSAAPGAGPSAAAPAVGPSPVTPAAAPGPAASEAALRQRSPAPRQLPGAARHFAGRADELAALAGLLGQLEEPAGTIVISAIGGTAGVGKTALAVHWAHRVAEHFPDGQLYVNLRGYDPGPPLPPADALAAFLRSLGVSGHDIPADPEERAARYRSLISGRRMLILLDNAREDDQVRPLLPATPTCVTLVTSRDPLAGLVARDGATRIDLDPLPLAEAVGLLRTLIGERSAADPAATEVLAGQCCRLPLALRVAAELAVARPAIPLAKLVAELADQQRRLDLLDAGGDELTAVRAVFSWSCRHLDPDATRTFRMAGLHPGPDLDPYAAAALTGATVDQARRALDVLARACLVQPTTPGRYGLHDLLRAYAAELAAQDTEEAQRQALTRLFDYYLYTAMVAMDALVPAGQQTRPRIPRPATAVPLIEPAVPAVPLAWLDAQRACLVAAVVHAAANGWPGHATRLAATLHSHLETSGHYSDGLTVHTCAAGAAHDTGDRAAEATELNSVGIFELREGYYQQAAENFRRSLALFREIGDRAGQSVPLGSLGLVSLRRGHYQQAAEYYRQSLELDREAGDPGGQAIALIRFGFLELRQGRYEQAAEYFRRALDLCGQVVHREAEAGALNGLGLIELMQERNQQAAEHFGQALAMYRQMGDRTGETRQLSNLGLTAMALAQYEEAAEHFDRALELSREIADRSNEVEALIGLGQVCLATGQPERSRAQLTAALSMAGRIGVSYLQARAHNNLGRTEHAVGDYDRARYHWREALVLFEGLGAPEADRARASLAELDDEANAES